MEEVRELVRQLTGKVSSSCALRDLERARHWLSKATAVAERSGDISIDNCVAEARTPSPRRSHGRMPRRHGRRRWLRTQRRARRSASMGASTSPKRVAAR